MVKIGKKLVRQAVKELDRKSGPVRARKERKTLTIILMLVVLSSLHAQVVPQLPPDKGTARIAHILRHTTLLVVECHEGVVSDQACRFVVNALSVDLRGRHITILPADDGPGPIWSPLYAPPHVSWKDSSISVTVALLEYGPPDNRTLVMGGCAFSNINTVDGIVPLPRWREPEGRGRITGPSESDRARAAARLARKFSSYWINPTANGGK